MIYASGLLFAGYFLINLLFALQNKYIGDGFWQVTKYQLWMIPVFFAANMLIGLGFKWGFKYFHNMTFVVSSSKLVDITTLLLVSYLIFAETPNLKVFIGIALIIAGLIITKI